LASFEHQRGTIAGSILERAAPATQMHELDGYPVADLLRPADANMRRPFLQQGHREFER